MAPPKTKPALVQPWAAPIEAPAGTEPGFENVHPLQRFRSRTVWRDAIKNAEYNPRVISESAKKKLQKGLEKLGLLQPLVWNKQTGNLVGGHQRLGLLDKLAGGTPNFALQVAEVDLTHAEEVEANLLLNNPETHGTWDLAKLDEALRTEGVRIEATGFDMGDIVNVLGESPFALAHGQELQQMADAQRLTTDAIDKANARMNTDRDDDDYYLVVVFRHTSELDTFCETLGLPFGKFQDGRNFQALLEPLVEQGRLKQAAIAEQTRAQVARELEASVAGGAGRGAQMTAKEAVVARDALKPGLVGEQEDGSSFEQEDDVDEDIDFGPRDAPAPDDQEPVRSGDEDDDDEDGSDEDADEDADDDDDDDTAPNGMREPAPATAGK